MKCRSRQSFWWHLLGAGVVLLGAAGSGKAIPPSPDEPVIRQTLAEILNRPEFRQGAEQSDRLEDPLVRFFAWLASLRETHTLLYWLLLGTSLTLLALLVAVLLWKVSQLFVAGMNPGGIAETPAQRRNRLSASYREEALHRAAAGDYTEAIRYLFLSLVYRFDESGRVGFQQAITNREYLALFAVRPVVQAERKVFVDTLDDHWYGQRPTDAHRYEECRGLYERLAAGKE